MSKELENSLGKAMQLAVQRHQSGDLAAAEALYRKVLSVAPRTLGALLNLSAICVGRAEFVEAIELLDEGVRCAGNDPNLRYARGVALQNNGQITAAIEDYRQVLTLQPHNFKACENLGVALQDAGQVSAAELAFRQALGLQRGSKIAWCNLIAVLRAQGRLQHALQTAEEALQELPADADLHMLRGTTQLSLGRFHEGWLGYESRYLSADQLRDKPPRMIPLAKWDGSDLRGRRILLHGEQGVGDEIMFASCVSELASTADQVALEADHRLVPLFARSFPDVLIVPRGEHLEQRVDLSGFDWRLSTASLPRFLRTDEASFPSGEAFLFADPSAVRDFRKQLEDLPGVLKIGISWRGGFDTRAQAARSIPLEHWRPLMASGACVVSLQYGDHEDEIQAFHAAGEERLQQVAGVNPLRDMDNFAALTAALDLIISIDNSTVHLAGALGRPTWVLLPPYADFRWLHGRKDSPWYRSLRLMQRAQDEEGGWAALIEQVAADLPPARATLAVGDPSLAHTGAAARPKPIEKAHRLLLMNDTSYWYHWGCSCTSLAIHRALRTRGYSVDSLPILRSSRLQPLPNTLDGFDDAALWQRFCSQNPDVLERLYQAEIVVINGEGTIHGLQPSAIGLLYLAYVAATRLHKPVQLINHSGYPSSGGDTQASLAEQLYAKVYRELAFIAVREPCSFQALQALHLDLTDSFDCLPLFVDDHADLTGTPKADRLVIAGSVAYTPALIEATAATARWASAEGFSVDVLVGANAYPAVDEANFANTLLRHLGGAARLCIAHSETEWLRTIARARLLISGRFHHSIAAAFLDTPFVLSDSNTLKTDGLLLRLGLDRQHVRVEQPAQLLDKSRALLKAPRLGTPRAEVRDTLLQLANKNFARLPAVQAEVPN